MVVEANAAAIVDVIAYCKQRYDNQVHKTNATFKRLYLRYLEWYVRHRNDAALSLTTTQSDHGVVYITQHNVDKYYSQYVVTTLANRDNTKRHLYALNWYLRHVENPLGVLIEESAIIRRSIDTQQAHYCAHSNTANAGIDPHKGLRDLMSDEDNLKILKYIWGRRPDYADLAFSYLWGRNAGVRGSSSRSFLLSDINHSNSYGPERTSPRNHTLMLILRRGSRHKDRYTINKQVGVQRHRDYRQCAVFATGVLVINRLREKGNTISFLHPNKNTRCNWWDVELSDFSKYGEESAAMLQVLQATDVDYCKVTHHRTQAVLIGGSRGLDPWKISSLTKHSHDKLHQSYMPEVEQSTMKVMSGFGLVSSIVYLYSNIRFVL
jgi:hypothetical protein